MVTLLEGGNKTPHTPQKCSPLCWEPIKRTPQSRSSLHNQIKTSPSQTIFKQSEHRCDSRQESTWLCLHEKDTTKMLPSNSNRVTCRQGDPLRRAPCCSPLARGRQPCSWPVLTALQAAPHTPVQRSLAAWETEGAYDCQPLHRFY